MNQNIRSDRFMKMCCFWIITMISSFKFWFKCVLYVGVILNHVNKLSKSRKYSRSCLCFCDAKEPVINALWPQNKVNAMKIFFEAIRMCSQYYTTWFYLLWFLKKNIHLSETAHRKLVYFAGKKPPLDSLKAIKNLIWISVYDPNNTSLSTEGNFSFFQLNNFLFIFLSVWPLKSRFDSSRILIEKCLHA